MANQRFSSSQLAMLNIIFAQAGDGKIPGSWLADDSVSDEKLTPALQAAVLLGAEAYGWGDHALAGYLTVETDPVFLASPAAAIVAADVTNWNLAFGWGDHALAGYLTAATFALHPASGIAATDIVNWNAAYGWGDHALAGYVVAPGGGLTIADWCSGGFLTGATVTEHTVELTSVVDGLVHRFRILGIDEGTA